MKNIRSVLFLSMADLFVSASAIILVLIIASPARTKNLKPQYVDFVVKCEKSKNSSWMIIEENKKKYELEQWITWKTKSGLLHKVGIEIEQTELLCYKEVDRLARAHNISLTEPSNAKASLSLIILPVKDEKE